MEQQNRRQLYEIQYTTQYNTTMKTPQQCEKEALTERMRKGSF